MGSQISIQCLISSSSLNSIQYEWYKEGQKISKQESVLNITDLRTDDAGIYSCVAKLGELFEASQTSLNLDVQGKLLTLLEPILQNGQAYSNNSSGICQRIAECV